MFTDAAESYSHTPRSLLVYTCVPLQEAFARQGEEFTRRAIDALFQRACENTGHNRDELLSLLSFDSSNQDADMLQSMFAVMRTINILDDIGFKGIKPLPATKIRKEADLLASWTDELFAIEVFRANERTWRFPGYKCEEYIARRFTDEKKFQLEATVTKYDCNKSLLVIVFDSDSKALLETRELEEVVWQAYVASGLPVKTHFLLFTGTQTPGVGNDYAIWPPLA